MLHDEHLSRHVYTITSIRPVFYMNEADVDQGDRPRLDLQITLSHGESVRYHPQAELIWLPPPRRSRASAAIRMRRKRLCDLRHFHGRDWEY